MVDVSKFRNGRHQYLTKELRIPRADVLPSATTEPAIALRHEGEFGEVKAGQRANLLVLAGNPTKNLSVYHDNGTRHLARAGEFRSGSGRRGAHPGRNRWSRRKFFTPD